MRVAFVGKGGSGKSAIAGTFARLLAREGGRVLVLDSDPMPGLALTLGVAATNAGLPDEATEENFDDDGPRYRLRADVSAVEAVERYALRGPDGVLLLQLGKLRGHVRALGRSQAAFHQIVRELSTKHWSLVGDLPGGTRQPFFGWGRFARTVVVVAEPTAASLLSARRLARLSVVDDAPQVVAVANKVTQPEDAAMVERRTGLAVVGSVPYDQELSDAERRGRPPLDAAPHCAAVQAVRSLVSTLAGREEAT